MTHPVKDMLENIHELELDGFEPLADPIVKRLIEVHMCLQRSRHEERRLKREVDKAAAESKQAESLYLGTNKKLKDLEANHEDYRVFVNQMREVYRRGSQAKTRKMKTWMARTLAELAVKFFAEEVPF